MNHDPGGRTTPRVPYDAVLYAELYRREESQIQDVARAVHTGRYSQAEGRERVLAIFAAVNARYLAAASTAARA